MGEVSKLPFKDEHRVIFYSLVASNLVFITNAALESLFIHKKPFLNSYILDVSSVEVFLRFIVFIIFVVYGFITSKIIKKRILWGEKLLQSKGKMQALLDAFPDRLFRIRRDGTILEIVSNQSEDPIPFPEQIIGKKIDRFLPKNEVELSLAAILEALSSGEMKLLENQFSIDNTTLYFETRIVPAGKEEVLAIIRDITDKKELERKLRFLSLRDELTGLYNRRGFFLLAMQQQKLAERDGTEMSLLYVDLDGLKTINDTYGHKEGDRVLVHTGNILQEAFRESDVVARIGGDEFAILLIDSSGNAVTTLIAHRLEKTMERENSTFDGRYDISLSYGISHYIPSAPCSIDDLLSRADENMYHHKKSRHKSRASIS